MVKFLTTSLFQRLLTLLLVFTGSAVGNVAYAQIVVPRGTKPSDLFPQNAKLAGQLALARTELQEKKYRLGLQRLGFLLGSERPERGSAGPPLSEDYFFAEDPEAADSFASLKLAALDLIGGLPAEGRDVYEDLYGLIARAELGPAEAAGDYEKIAEVARRYYHTMAGYEAAYRLAAYRMDQGRPLAAARIYNRLLKQDRAAKRWNPVLSVRAAICWSRAGRIDLAAELLANLEFKGSADKIVFGGIKLSAIADIRSAPEQLMTLLTTTEPAKEMPADYQFVGGRPSRNLTQHDNFPFLRPRWQVSSVQNTPLRQFVARFDRSLNDGQELNLPAAQPLLVGNRLIVKTFGNEVAPAGTSIRAYRVDDGRLLWQTAVDPTFDPLPLNRPYPSPRGQVTPEDVGEQMARQFVWHDNTFANLSSDRSSIFSVEELLSIKRVQRATIAPLNTFNVLRAYDVRNGAARWEIGGPPGTAALPLAGTFFLGPPLPLEGRLYCLVEQDRQIRLLVLDPETGRLVWSQSLLAVLHDRDSLQSNPWRRVTGLSPAATDGLLICPTGVGGIVGFDLEQRCLLWHSHFRRSDGRAGARRAPMRSISQLHVFPGQDGSRWLDSTILIAEGRIFATPQESHELLCLDLLSGEPLWRKPKLDRLQVVGVERGHVAVVGSRQIEIFDVRNGQPIHKTPIAAPSGRAVFAGNRLLVPLSSAEVIVVDPRTGAVLERARSADAVVPGNLLSHPSGVISQGVTSLSVFQDVQQTERQVAGDLSRNPRDRTALVTRAELARQSGRLLAAAEDYRRVYDASGDPVVREELLDLSLQGLRTNFEEFRPRTDAIEELLEEFELRTAPATAVGLPQLRQPTTHPSVDSFMPTDRRGTYQRLLGLGYAAAGDPARSYEAISRYAAGSNGLYFDAVEKNWGVRRDRWFAARLAELLKVATPELRQQITRQSSQEVAAASDPRQAAALRRVITRYRSLPAAEQALRSLVDAVTDGIRPLESELALIRLRDGFDEQSAMFATAKLAELLLDFDHITAAADSLDDLRRLWPETEVTDGKTGTELVEKFSATPGVEQALSGASPWPSGRVNVAAEAAGGNRMTRMFNLPLSNPERRSASTLNFDFDNSRGAGVSAIVTGWTTGTNPQWRVEIPNINMRSFQAQGLGDLIIIRAGTELLALDTLGWPSGTGGEDAALRVGEILWRKSLAGSESDLEGASRAALAYGRDRRGRLLGRLGPVTAEAVFYQQGRSLFAVDPMTGMTIWQQGGIEYGSRLFLDDDRLMAVSPDSRVADYYSTADGSILGRREYIPGKQEIVNHNGNVLCLEYVNKLLVIQSRHVWSNTVRWKEVFQPPTPFTLVGEDRLAILPPSGELTLLSINDGKPIFRTPVPIKSGPKSLAVIPSGDIDIFVVYRGRPSIRRQPAGGARNLRNVLVTGSLYGVERRTGRLLWSQQVAQQHLDLSQPRGMPIVVLTKPLRVNSRSPEHKMKLLCLDKRTGRTIFDGEETMSQRITYNVDAEGQTVQLNLGRRKLRFQFTDEPIESESSDADAPQSEKSEAQD